MGPEEFRKKAYDQISQINEKICGLDRIDTALDELQETLGKQTEEFKKLHAECVG